MDKNFQNLLAKYLKGNCTAEEIESVNRWYEEIADNNLDLEQDEKQVMRTRMLSNIRESLARHNRPARRHRYLSAPSLIKVAASVALLAIAGLWFFTGADVLIQGHFTEIGEVPATVVLENETDSDKVYSLPDGTTVRLGSSSRLHFNRDFSAGKREVHLTGHGFFDVVRDPSRPFYVYSRQIATRVLGTSFFVDAPENGTKVEVQVITGKVSVFRITDDRTSAEDDASMQKHSATNGVVLSPNQKVEYYTEENHWVAGLVEEPLPVKSIDEETISFVFESTPLETVLADIQSRFGIELVMEDDRIGQCAFTGDVSNMTLYDMLDVISNSIGSTYEVKGTRILITGKGCD